MGFPQRAEHVEPFRVWEFWAFEWLGNENAFFPPPAVSVLVGKDTIGKKSTEKGCSDIRVLSDISKCLIAWYYKLVLISATLLIPLHHWDTDCFFCSSRSEWLGQCLPASSRQSATGWLTPVNPWRKAPRPFPNAGPLHILLWEELGITQNGLGWKRP